MPATPGTNPAPPTAGLAAKTVPISAGLTRLSHPALPVGPPALSRAFTLVLPSTGWAVFLQHGRSRVLPVFTGPDAVRDFLDDARVPRCRVHELQTAGAVADFLRAPPGRLGGAGEFLVAVDPADLTNLAPALFAARELVAAIAGGRR